MSLSLVQYELYLEHQADLVREMGHEATAALTHEAERALGLLDGVDRLANSRLMLIVADWNPGMPRSPRECPHRHRRPWPDSPATSGPAS
jgi:hypothetical protein